MDSQLVELLGRNYLIDALLRAGLEVAIPARDRGIDLIAYADIETKVDSFVARPIQMKAASKQTFAIDRKYSKFPNLLIAFVWNLNSDTDVITYALSYTEAVGVAEAMGYTKTGSWRKGKYATTRPSVELRRLLEPYIMTPERWWQRVTQGN